MAARIAVVGTGWWATWIHIPTVREEGAEVVAICDTDPARLAEVGGRFGIAPRYTDTTEMMAAQEPDGVIVATPHVAHAAPALAALRGGAHVLVEKPMATNAADARAIVAAAAAAGRQVMVPTGLNYTRYSSAAARMVREGRIGEVRHALCHMGSALHDLMAGEPMAETVNHLYRPPPSTWTDPARAGGYAWGQLSHALGWLFYVSGLQLETVCNLDGKAPTGTDYYDAAAGRATNGATVVISGAATVPKHRGMQTDIRLFGTEGVLFFDCERDRARLEVRRMDGDDTVLDLAPGEADYDGRLPVRTFCALCRGETVENPADAENGARVTEALAAMYRSAASGRIERV